MHRRRKFAAGRVVEGERLRPVHAHVDRVAGSSHSQRQRPQPLAKEEGPGIDLH